MARICQSALAVNQDDLRMLGGDGTRLRAVGAGG